MASRPESRAKGPVRDVRSFEEDRCLSRKQAATLVSFLMARVRAAPTAPEILCEVNAWLPLRDSYAFLFLLGTALRRFEFCRATCGEVDLVEAKLWVLGKNRVKDFVPLTGFAVQLIRTWLEVKRARGESTSGDAPLFCASSGEFLSFSNLRLRWKQTLLAAGLPKKFGLHAARHTGGLLAYAATGSIEKTARFLRHRDTAVTAKHYLHVDVDDLRRELSNVDIWRTE